MGWQFATPKQLLVLPPGMPGRDIQYDPGVISGAQQHPIRAHQILQKEALYIADRVGKSLYMFSGTGSIFGIVYK